MKYSPSASHKWKKCPAYVHLIEFAPKSQTIYAADGTKTHKACELAIRDGVPLIMTVVKKDHREAAQLYVDYVQKIEKECNSKALIEEKFSFSIYGQKIKGTPDTVVIDKANKKAYIIDLKTGTGLSIDAIGNTQLILYAIGVLMRCKRDGIEINDFDLVIVQPLDFKDESIRVWSIDKEKLINEAKELFKSIEYNVLHATEYYSGNWCSMCDCITICPLMQGYYKLTKQLQNRGKQLSKDEIKDIIENQSLINKYMTEVVKIAKASVKDKKNAAIDYGMKWVFSSTNRVPVDTKQLLKDIVAAGHKKLIKPKIPTLKELKELFGEKWIKERFMKPDGVPVLVPASDRRKEIEIKEETFKEKVKGF